MVDVWGEYFTDATVLLAVWNRWFRLQLRLDITAGFRLELSVGTNKVGLPTIEKFIISFLRAPSIDVNLGEICQVLFINFFINQFLEKLIQDYFILPKHLLEILNTSTSSSSEGLRLPDGVLAVWVRGASGLLNKERLRLAGDVSDPYTVLSFDLDGERHSLQSRTVSNSLDPAWDLLALLPADRLTSLSDLQLAVLDSNLLTSDCELGRGRVGRATVADLSGPGHATARLQPQLQLAGRPAGQLDLWLGWCPARPLPGSGPGLLVVWVDCCRNLSRQQNKHPHWQVFFN